MFVDGLFEVSLSGEDQQKIDEIVGDKFGDVQVFLDGVGVVLFGVIKGVLFVLIFKYEVFVKYIDFVLFSVEKVLVVLVFVDGYVENWLFILLVG